jgi:hypothetical protein
MCQKSLLTKGNKEMNRFVELFKKKQFPLIVSIPQNDIDFAKAAQDNGADAVKVHTSVKHPASGIEFGPLNEEASKFEEIRKVLDTALGIVPGVGCDLEMDEIRQMADIGFDFFDAYISNITPLIMQEERLAPMLCVLPDHTVEEAVIAASLPHVVCIEADIVRHEGYGKRLSIEDCIKFHILSAEMSKPLIVPTQRNIRPEDIPSLYNVHAGGIMIGAIVTGMTVEGVAIATRAFREAIDVIAR